MAASASPPPRRTHSLVQAASLLGVHRNTLSKWIGQGCPVVTKADRSRGLEWELDLTAVVDWRITRAVEDAISGYQDGAGNISKDEADRRRAVANAITAEVAADEALDVVLRREDAEADVAAFCMVLKTGLSNAASKIAARAAGMSSAAEIETLCHSELNRSFETAQAELASRWMGERKDDADNDNGED